MIVRIAKVLLVGALASYAFIVAYDNIVDYGSNYQFVRHVLSMDTTLPNNALMYRAITNENVWSAVYALIIACEWLICLLLVIGAAGVAGSASRACRTLQSRQDLGHCRFARRLWSLVHRFFGGGGRILRHVAVADMERAGGGVPADGGNSRRADLCQFARRRLTENCALHSGATKFVVIKNL